MWTVALLPAFAGLAAIPADAAEPARSALFVGATVVPSCTVTTRVPPDAAAPAVVSCTADTAATVTVERLSPIRPEQPASRIAAATRITVTY